MSFSRSCVVGLLLSPWIAALPAASAQESVQAEDATFARPWAAGFAVQAEETDGHSLYATFNVGIAQNTWLFFSAGQNEYSDDISDITTTSLYTGVDHRFGRVGLTFKLESWGDSEEVESKTVGGSFYVMGERFRLDFEVEDRDIELTPFLSDRLSMDVAGQGTGVRSRFELTPAWQLYLHGMTYDYQWHLPAVPPSDSVLEFCNRLTNVTCDEVNRFVALLDRANGFITSTLGTGSFLDSEATIGLEWRAGHNLINLSYTVDRAMDEARSETSILTASVLFPISRRMDLEVNLGKVDSEIFETSIYGGLFFLIYGGG